jgi:hypothetical protein
MPVSRQDRIVPEEPTDRSRLRLAVTIDVEEEGLFLGQYASGAAPTENVGELLLLDPIFREWDIRPTLLVSYQVIRHPRHRDLLASLADRWGAEIGAHLHPWNTPPLEPLPYREPVPSELMPRELLTAKLRTLLDTLKQAGFSPSSFRMGRFNVGPNLFSVLHEARDIQVDSSVAPMRKYYGGPVRLGLLTDPYFPDVNDPMRLGSSRILEVPVTVAPFVPALGRLLARLDEDSVFPDTWIPEIAAKVASLPAQPMWTGLRRLKAAVRLHRHRGGGVITTFFHSSEIMAGGCPGHATPEHVARFLVKLTRFLGWLRTELDAEPLTLSELGALHRNQTPNRDASQRH